MIELKKYTSTNVSYRLDIYILSHIKLSTHTEQAQREKIFIEDISKRIQKANTVLYLLKHNNDILGFVALSISSIGDFPSLQIDYLLLVPQLQLWNAYQYLNSP